jgi:Rho termination factor, N-terminal domain
MRRLLRFLITAALLGAGALALKAWLDGSDFEATEAPSSESPQSSATGGSNGSPRPTKATKAELYEQAKKLGIENRSKMSKAELERAIRQAS